MNDVTETDSIQVNALLDDLPLPRMACSCSAAKAAGTTALRVRAWKSCLTGDTMGRHLPDRGSWRIPRSVWADELQQYIMLFGVADAIAGPDCPAGTHGLGDNIDLGVFESVLHVIDVVCIACPPGQTREGRR